MSWDPNQTSANNRQEQSTALPLSQTLGQLPGQYANVVLRPSASNFAQQMEKATWGSVCLQLIIWTLTATVLGYLGNVITPVQTTSSTGPLNPTSLQILQDFSFATSYGLLLLIPIIFFSWTGLMFLLGKAFGGAGTFRAQCYTTLLFQVPLGILGSILGLIPLIGWLGIVLFIYNIMLQVHATVGVHQLTGRRATVTVLILLAILLAILCPLTFAVTLFIALSQLR